MPALPLTPEQKAESARLKTLFQEWQASRKEAGEPVSQDAASGMLGFGQSALSQYLNGRIPLNAQAAAKFAKLLNCRIEEFSPSIAHEASQIAEGVSPQPSSTLKQLDITDLNKIEGQLVLMFRELPQDSRDDVIQLTNRLYNKAKPGKSSANPFNGATPPAPPAPPKAGKPPAPAKKAPKTPKQHA